MLGRVKSSLTAAWANARSWHTNRKIVIFESDDWGCLRVKDRSTWEALSKAGIDVSKSAYDRVDCLETDSDLENLLEVIGEFRDSKGNHPAFTMNAVMANPDFERIEQSAFEEYHSKNFFESYRDYRRGCLESLWHQGQNEKLIEPQFHGREHLNVALWLSDLKAGQAETLFAFDHEYFGLPTRTGSRFQKHYLAAFWAENRDQLQYMRSSISDGLAIFRSLFGFGSLTMVPCNYVFPVELEKTALQGGIKMIQTQRGYTAPDPTTGTPSIIRPVTGQLNSAGQFQSVRNVLFEPFETDRRCAVGKALAQIRSAFMMKSPAIISTHRANYVGGLSPKNRAENSKLLRELLTSLLRIWPQIEFETSTSLCRQFLDANVNDNAYSA